MIKGLFILYDFSTRNIDISSGISKKIYAQKEVLESLPCKMEFYNPYEYKMDNIIFRVCRRLPLWGYLNKPVVECDYQEYDFVYIRKPWLMDVDTLFLLRKIKKENNKIIIIMELPTYPYDYEMEKISMYPLLVKDKIYRHLLKKYVDRIVTYSEDKSIWGIKTICISNGVKMDERLDEFTENDEVNIIAVSNLAFWHGYDRAIEGLNNYYSSGGKENIILHIVGTGNELKKLKRIVDKYNLGDKVIFYGRKSKDELIELYKICKIGMDSLGRHRSKVYYNSSLKSKEYLMKGLLVVSAVKNELDYEENYPYYLRIPANDVPVDYNKILSFYHKIYDFDKEENIRRKIIKFGIKTFSMEKAMKSLMRYLRCMKL
ncbi:Glycosyltransferase involved in cell wall bisynthesis [Selenomonas sp. WCT3]|uniref:glycosyltransferase n=1 Tax=Selenomonas sp. WCT3 TaxID=3158785 RepID=UPI000883250F|nr:Glycosyltransferase involved in cell wall bisynthesis [Selenomonas ruminantium]